MAESTAGDLPAAVGDVVEVTAVIPTHNRARLVARALASALAQEDTRLEIIVIDDCSDDGTASFLRRLDDPRLRVLTLSPGQGVARARNAAIAQARGVWTAFLDDDDVWAPHKLRRQLAVAGENGAAFVYGPAVVIDENGHVKRVTEPTEPARLGGALLETNTVGTPSGVVARTELVRDMGGFDELLSTFADWDLWLRLLQRGPASMVDEPLFAYLEHPANMHITQIGSARRELRYLARKHRGLCKARGVRFGSVYLSRWLLGQYRPQSRRLDAAREYLRIGVRYRSRRDLGRAFGMLLGERFLRLGRTIFGAERDVGAGQELSRSQATPSWLTEALAGDAFSTPSGSDSGAV